MYEKLHIHQQWICQISPKSNEGFFLKGGGQADLFWNNGIEMIIGQRSIMDTQSFKGILRPLSHMSANLGLDRLWGLKNRFFK